MIVVGILLILVFVIVLVVAFSPLKKQREKVVVNSPVVEADESKQVANASVKKSREDQSVDSQFQNNSVKLEPEIQQALRKMINTSSEGLVEEKTENGVSVDLQGRFQTVPVATITTDGEVEVRDYTSQPAQGQ